MTDAPTPNVFSILQSRQKDWQMALIAKRTYSLVPNKRCPLHDEQVPLVLEQTFDDRDVLVHDLDVVVVKERTDVILKGAAHSHFDKPVTQLDVGIEMAGQSKMARVMGDRVCYYKNAEIAFSSPNGFTAMPLDYTRAYGGSDERARESLDVIRTVDLQTYTPHDLFFANLCIYPRNAVGKGYALARDDRLDEMPLPNVEDVNDLLTPARLVVPDPKKWYLQPIPMGFDFYDYNWFPRSTHFGIKPGLYEIRRDELPKVHEIQKGYVTEEDIFPPPSTLPMGFHFSDKYINAASPGLSFPYLLGDEEIRLQNMDREHPDFVFHLPDDRPRMTIRPLDEETVEVVPKLYTVIIEKEENLVSLVWGGVVKPRLPHGPDQLQKVEHTLSWKR